MNGVILLNQDYTPNCVISIKKAMQLISRGIVEAVSDLSFNLGLSEGRLYRIPKILRLLKIVRNFYKRGVRWTKRNVLIRDEYICQYCGHKEKSLTIDHITPKCMGGKNTFENTVACCRDCNQKKGGTSCTKSGMYPKGKPYHPTIVEFHIKKMKIVGATQILEEILGMKF